MSVFSEDCRFYKVILPNYWNDKLVVSVSVHTHPERIDGNYIVLGLAKAVKHSRKAACVFAYVNEELSGLNAKVIKWMPPDVENQGLREFFAAPLCIEVGYKDARGVVNRLQEKKRLSAANFKDLTACVDELEDRVHQLSLTL